MFAFLYTTQGTHSMSKGMTAKSFLNTQVILRSKTSIASQYCSTSSTPNPINRIDTTNHKTGS